MKIFSTATILVGFLTPLAAQWVHRPTAGIPRTADGKPNLTAPAPRTADGHPDLGGLWEAISTDGAIGNVAVRKPGDLKPEDIQPWVQAMVKQRAENFGIDNPHYRCLPDGPNYSTGGGMKQIIQTPTMIVFLNEDLTYRTIHMDGRELEKDANPSWMGYYIGHWDGDTLVVESNGFNDQTWLLGGYPHTEDLRMTERFRRVDFGHLEMSVTFQDPKAYSKPWTVQLKADLAPDTEMMEAVCNDIERTREREHWIGKTTDAEKTRVKVATEILAKYPGVYKGDYLRGPRTVEVTLSGDTLFISVNGGPKTAIVPQSETNFSGTGLTYRFVRDGPGMATALVEGHISGDYNFARQR